MGMFKQGAGKAIGDLLRADNLARVADMFDDAGTRSDLATKVRRGENVPALEELYQVVSSVPDDMRPVAHLLTSQKFGIALAKYNERNTEAWGSKYAQLYKKEWDDLAAEAKADILVGLYNSGQKRCFAWAVQNINPRNTTHVREVLAAVKDHPEFPHLLVFIPYSSTGSTQQNKTVLTSELVLIVSNSEIGAEHDKANGFELISTERVHTSLSTYMSEALRGDTASAAYGRYHFSDKHNTSFEGAAALYGEILHAVAHKSNFYAFAYDRMEHQIDQMQGIWHGNNTGFRFLRQRGAPDWARALWTLSKHQFNKLTPDGVEEAAYALAKYNFGHMFRTFYNVTKHPKEGVSPGMLGWNRALQEKMEMVKELSSRDDRPSDALDTYEARYGFHPRFPANMPLSDKKHAAYVDICEQITGLMDESVLDDAFFEGEEGAPSRPDGFFEPQKLMQMFVDLKYVDGIERLLDSFSCFKGSRDPGYKRVYNKLLEPLKEVNSYSINSCYDLRKPKETGVTMRFLDDEWYIRMPHKAEFQNVADIVQPKASLTDLFVASVAFSTTKQRIDGMQETPQREALSSDIEKPLRTLNEAVVRRGSQIVFGQLINEVAVGLWGTPTAEDVQHVKDMCAGLPKEILNRAFWDMGDGNPKPVREGFIAAVSAPEAGPSRTVPEGMRAPDPTTKVDSFTKAVRRKAPWPGKR